MKGFFSSPRGQKPHERYAIPIVPIDTVDFLKGEVQQILESVQSVFVNLSQLLDDCLHDISIRKQELQKTVLTAWVEQAKTQQEMEIATDEQQEQQMQTLTESELEQEEVLEIHRPRVSNYRKQAVPWNLERLFDEGYWKESTKKDEIRYEETFQQIASLHPVISLEDILAVGKLKPMADFDGRIHGSLNLFPVFQSIQEQKQLFVPFGLCQGAWILSSLV